MDDQELRTDMLKSLVIGMKNISDERKTTNGTPYFIELGGRLEAMRTMVDYLMGLGDLPAEEQQEPKKGCDECKGECQGHPDSGGEEDVDTSKEEGEAK